MVLVPVPVPVAAVGVTVVAMRVVTGAVVMVPVVGGGRLGFGCRWGDRYGGG